MMKLNGHITEIKSFLLLIPLINLFNYYLTYYNISFTWRTFLTFSIDTVLGYIAWMAVHFIILYLDKRLPFSENALKRLSVQLISTLVAGIFIIISLTVIIHYSVKDGPIPTSFFTYDIFIIAVWFLVINGIYVATHFYNEWKRAEESRIEEAKIRTGGLNVKSGKQEFVLNYEEVAGLMVDGDYIICYTMGGKKFLLDQSMDKLEKVLPASWFFRLNRQFLLHRQIISGFEKAEYGKLNILIKGCAPLPAIINVSRIRASSSSVLVKEYWKI